MVSRFVLLGHWLLHRAAAWASGRPGEHWRQRGGNAAGACAWTRWRWGDDARALPFDADVVVVSSSPLRGRGSADVAKRKREIGHLTAVSRAQVKVIGLWPVAWPILWRACLAPGTERAPTGVG